MHKFTGKLAVVTLAIMSVMTVGCDTSSEVVTAIANSGITFITDAITTLLQSLVSSGTTS